MILDDGLKAIAELNLEPIKVKLMHKESGEGWTLEYANTIEFEYRRFLYLMKKFPTAGIAPLFDVDIFWHYHILDTMKYSKDCENVFGYFLHHFPYLGLRGEDDEQAHHDAGMRMQQLYEETFDEPWVRSHQAAGRTASTITASHPPEVSERGFSSPVQSAATKTAFSWSPPSAPGSSAAKIRHATKTAFSWSPPSAPGSSAAEIRHATKTAFSWSPPSAPGSPAAKIRHATKTAFSWSPPSAPRSSAAEIRHATKTAFSWAPPSAPGELDNQRPTLTVE